LDRLWWKLWWDLTRLYIILFFVPFLWLLLWTVGMFCLQLVSSFKIQDYYILNNTIDMRGAVPILIF
jgi:hypothetical protein